MSRVDCPEGIDRGIAWHYGYPLIEQRALEAGQAIAELTNREIFTITGDARLEWLHNLTTQDLTTDQVTAGLPVLALSALGHIQHGFYLVDDGETAWCWSEAGASQPIIDWLNSMKFWTQVDIQPRQDLSLVHWGSNLAQPEQVLARSGELVIVADYQLDPSARMAGSWAIEALRIAAGIPRIGVDTDAKTIPNEIGLYGTALNKGCYPGQETVARIYNLGRPPRRLVRLLFDGQLPRAGSELKWESKTVGLLTSVAEHHELGPIGLALVKRSVPTSAVFTAEGIEASQEPLVDPEVGIHFRMQR